MSSTDFNPYESPRDPNLPRNQFADDRAELTELRRRVQELERRVGRNWLVHPNWLLRICGVFGYWILGYMFLAALFFGVMALIRLASGHWP